MNEELTPQKERFLREVEQKLLRRDLDARLLEDGLIHVRWNERPLCSVDRDGIVRFRPADVPEDDEDDEDMQEVETAAKAAAMLMESKAKIDVTLSLEQVKQKLGLHLT